jgi:hypothetical protein
MIIYSPTLSGSTILSGSLKVSGSVFIKNTIIGSSSYALRSLTASYSLKSGAGGTTLITGSLYPITSSWSRKAITASYALNFVAGTSGTSGASGTSGTSGTNGSSGTSGSSGSSGNSGSSGSSGASGTSLTTGSLYPITSSWSRRSITASYALNASGGGGSTLQTGSLYPITSSYATYAINAITNYTIATLSGTSIDWVNNTLEKNISTSENYTFTGVGTGSAIVVILNNTGSNNILPTFPVSVKWANSLTPTNILPNATSIYTFLRSKKYILASSTENYQ